MVINCLQYKVISGNIEDNLILFYNSIKTCSKKKANIIILPEMWYTGFDYENLLDLSRNTGYICEKISAILQADMIVFSSLPEKEGGKVYNTVFILSNKGIVSKYRKNMLFAVTGEDKFFSRSHGVISLDFMGAKLSPFLCYEIRFPEIIRLAAYMYAEVIIVPAIWPATKKDHWLTLLKARAIENQCFVVGCNASEITTSKKTIKCGYSSVFDPWGNNLGLLDNQPSILECNINPLRSKEIRKSMPCIEEAINTFDIEINYNN